MFKLVQVMPLLASAIFARKLQPLDEVQRFAQRTFDNFDRSDIWRASNKMSNDLSSFADKTTDKIEFFGAQVKGAMNALANNSFQEKSAKTFSRTKKNLDEVS